MSQISENKQISPYMVFYMITTMQVGVGILGFERYIAKSAGHDAWIAVVLGGLSFNIIIWMIYRILLKEKTDIIGVHRSLFGRWIGGLLSVLLLLYFSSIVITILRTYIEVIQIWVFPQLGTEVIAIIFLFLAYSYVIGGIRVVAGLAVLGFFITIPLFLLKYYALKSGHYSNLLPFFEHSITEILAATKGVTLNYVGFELILIYLPFLKQPEKSQKWAHYGNFFTIFTYLITIVVSFVYYNQEQLQHTIWATLTLWKIVDLPFAQRFEYAGIALWLFVILPNVCIGLWSVSRGLHRLFKIKQKSALRALLLVVFTACILVIDRQQIDMMNNTVSKVGFYILYLYIPFLFVTQLIFTKVRKTKNG
ncbi:spore gernimation protein GerB [Fictibacillus phosphorivorans]|uniref:Spore gernimation protein GerB n=1 Tax=Fictibacillus phosphorivorans TaxID=1221500 RepID=A0A165P7D2_9BACL|nr:GerAB/ArcD/ProY family transporter [Fictibacillus phosphorivorans]KZE69230.1 spore gernimation protein GerB [Fictibacillus phosphorivorans]